MKAKLKFPCNTTRFFFEKVNGKQFHPKWSACDDFSVRLQIRKHKSVKWEKVARELNKTPWLLIFLEPGTCSTHDTKLVATFRRKKRGNHKRCILVSKSYKKALAFKIRKRLKTVNYDWPLKCKLRKK